MEGAARRAQQRQPVAPIIEAPKPEPEPVPTPEPSNVVKLMTVLRVIDLVARMHGCTSAEMKGPGKTKRVVAGRDAAMCAVAVFKPHLSRGQIGLLFNRDPSTVLHALRKRGIA
jgi:chromosomal replication initiation ATPase DnaA